MGREGRNQEAAVKWRLVEQLQSKSPTWCEMKQFVSDLVHGFCAAAIAGLIVAFVVGVCLAVIGNQVGVLGW